LLSNWIRRLLPRKQWRLTCDLTTLAFKWKLKKPSYMKKMHNYELEQHFIYLEQIAVGVLVFCNCVYFSVYFLFCLFSFLCISHFSGLKVHSMFFFLFRLVFLLYLIN